MELLVKCEIVAIFVLPFLLAILQRRGAITARQMAFAVATLLSLFVGSLYLSLGNPESLFSLTFQDWSVAIALSLFSWALLYPYSLWLHKQWFQK